MLHRFVPWSLGVRARSSNGLRRCVAPKLESLEARLVLSVPSVVAHISQGADPDRNGVILRPYVSISGTAKQGAIISVVQVPTGKAIPMTFANRQGNYYFNLPIREGTFKLEIDAVTQEGVKSKAFVNVTRSNILTDAEKNLVNVMIIAKTPVAKAKSNLALLQNAVDDAFDTVNQGGTSAHGGLKAPQGTSASAASASAAQEVSTSLYPAQASTFKAAFDEALSTIPAGQARASGVSFGLAVGRSFV